MLYLDTIETKYEEVNVKKELEMESKYFWSSRSVYAIEFKKNVIDDYYEVNMIQVNFQSNTIKRSKSLFSKKHPLRISRTSEEWVQELIKAFQSTSYFESRTKKQFDEDFNAVISTLKSYRE